MNFDLAVDDLIYKALAESEELFAVLPGGVPVYQAPPQEDLGETPAAYIELGDTVATAYDTQTSRGVNATVSIHTWTSTPHRGPYITKKIQGAVYSALSRKEFYDIKFHIVSVDSLSSRTFPDPDGVSVHGVQEFRVLIEFNEV